MEAIIRHEELKYSAEQTKTHAETILISAMHKKPMINGLLMFKASGQGMEYITGVAMAVALITRNWSRVVADDSALDIASYLDDDEDCDMPLAHDLVRQAIRVQNVPQADEVREEMKRFCEKYDAHQFGRLLVHFVFLCADLVTAIMDVANTLLEQREGGGDDR